MLTSGGMKEEKILFSELASQWVHVISYQYTLLLCTWINTYIEVTDKYAVDFVTNSKTLLSDLLYKRVMLIGDILIFIKFDATIHVINIMSPNYKWSQENQGKLKASDYM